MADIITYPENGITYDADDAAGYLATRLSGVYSADEDFAVTPGGGTDVQISAGHAWIRLTRWIGRSVIMQQASLLTLTAADANLPRIDRIVLRYDALARKTVLTALSGTPASSPTAPEITRTSQTYDLCIAEVRRPAGSAAILTADITDTRMDEDLCGLMRDGVVGFPTAVLLQQYQAQLQQFRAQVDALIDQLQQSIDNVDGGSFYTKDEADSRFALAEDLANKLTRLERMMTMDGKLTYSAAASISNGDTGSTRTKTGTFTVPTTADYIVIEDRGRVNTVEKTTSDPVSISTAVASNYGVYKVARGGSASVALNGNTGTASLASDGTLTVTLSMAGWTSSAFTIYGYQYL